jgi:hypothetical protein
MGKPRMILIGVAALLVVVVGASLYWGQHKKARLRGDITALVSEASARLRAALSMEADQDAANSPEGASRLEQFSAQFDQQVEMLRAMDTERDAALAAAAEDLLTTARQLTMYQARMHRARIAVGADAAALAEHIRTVSHRERGWIDEALHKKELLEKKYFDYRLASDAFGDLARTYIVNRRKLAPLIGSAALVDESLAIDARDRAREAAKQTAALVDQARQLSPGR